VAAALDGLDATFYDGLTAMYRGKRDLLHTALLDAGFRCRAPQGAYYILADFSDIGAPAMADDTAFAAWLSREIGVTPVPGSSFYRDGGGRSTVRFVFCKTEDILAEAALRLRGLRGIAPGAAPAAGARAPGPALESGLQR
jgi:aminotransferase